MTLSGSSEEGDFKMRPEKRLAEYARKKSANGVPRCPLCPFEKTLAISHSGASVESIHVGQLPKTLTLACARVEERSPDWAL